MGALKRGRSSRTHRRSRDGDPRTSAAKWPPCIERYVVGTGVPQQPMEILGHRIYSTEDAMHKELWRLLGSDRLPWREELARIVGHFNRKHAIKNKDV